MGGPTSSIRYRQHSSLDHVTTQAPPLRQSRDTFGGTLQAYSMKITGKRTKIDFREIPVMEFINVTFLYLLIH
jgi:hypothetical protein